MQEFVYMPKELWPDEAEHVDYDPVYRATKNINQLTVEDFLPWNVEHKNQKRTFKNLFKKPEYGMSVFTNLGALEETLEKVPSLNRKIRSISKGRTSLARGISTKENEKHHVEYFLYDYINNSPKDDFEICIIRDKSEEDNHE